RTRGCLIFPCPCNGGGSSLHTNRSRYNTSGSHFFCNLAKGCKTVQANVRFFQNFEGRRPKSTALARHDRRKWGETGYQIARTEGVPEARSVRRAVATGSRSMHVRPAVPTGPKSMSVPGAIATGWPRESGAETVDHFRQLLCRPRSEPAGTA